MTLIVGMNFNIELCLAKQLKLIPTIKTVKPTYGTAQRQLDSRGQTIHGVWHFCPHLRVLVQAHTHATSYLLQVISTTDKNTSLLSSILQASHRTHTLSSPSQIFHVPFHFAY